MGSLPIPESRFGHLDDVPMDEAFMIMRDFALDEHPGKISLGAGVYRDDEAKPWVLPSVKEVWRSILYSPQSAIEAEYPGIETFHWAAGIQPQCFFLNLDCGP